jgi:hypothetical protein
VPTHLALSLQQQQQNMDKKPKKFKIFPDNESIKNEKETRNNTIIRSSATEATATTTLATVASPTKTSPASTSSATQATTLFPEPMWTIKEFDKTPLLEAKSIKELQVKKKEKLFSFMNFGLGKKRVEEEEERRLPIEQQQLDQHVTIEIVDIEGTLSLSLFANALSTISSLSLSLSTHTHNTLTTHKKEIPKIKTLKRD